MKVVCTYHACSRARERHGDHFGTQNVAEQVEEEVRRALAQHRSGLTSPTGHTLGAAFKQGHVLAWTKGCKRVYIVRVKAKERIVVTCLPAAPHEAVAA